MINLIKFKKNNKNKYNIFLFKVKNSKGRRYSEDFIVLCMLLHIRSPGGYNFLKNNSLLPLPSIRTIRRYSALLDMKYGFDKKIFELFKNHLHKKISMQKHGIILFDEMFKRQAISVCSKTLTYKGLVDFGEDKKANDIKEQATQALVFMFQPLADNYTQPLAIFASKGPVVGIELAKLLVKCIIILEKSGAVVHGFVSDGAQTNRKMWLELGMMVGKIR